MKNKLIANEILDCVKPILCNNLNSYLIIDYFLKIIDRLKIEVIAPMQKVINESWKVGFEKFEVGEEVKITYMIKNHDNLNGITQFYENNKEKSK